MAEKELSKEELWILSYYRASELAGALLFGRLARRVEDDEMRVFLTEHFAEEASHAWLWTKLIRDLGETPLQITQTYQSAYAKEIGIPTSMADILLLTKIFEERVFDHFTKHMNSESVHPVVKKTLEQMLGDEEGHLDWVEKKLAEYDKNGIINYDEMVKRYKKIDERIYNDVMSYEENLWNFLK